MSILDRELITTADDDHQLWLFKEIGATKDFRITKEDFLKEDRSRLSTNESNINDNTNAINDNTNAINVNTLALVPLDKTITEVSDDYAYEISADIYEKILDCTSIGVGKTITFTKGSGVTLLNKVTIVNPSANRAILTDGTRTYWAEPNDIFAVYFIDTELLRSIGKGLVFEDQSYSGTYVDSDDMIDFNEEDQYLLEANNGSTVAWVQNMYITSEVTENRSANLGSSADRYFKYTTPLGFSIFGITGHNIKRVWKYYTGAN